MHLRRAKEKWRVYYERKRRRYGWMNRVTRGGAVVCFDLGCRKYSRRGTLVLHRAIDTSQLKCDVCPLFGLYNVFCSPTRVERCWTAHESRPTEIHGEKGERAIWKFHLFPANASRIRAEPSNRVYVWSPVMRRDYLETKREELEGNTDRSVV